MRVQALLVLIALLAAGCAEPDSEPGPVDDQAEPATDGPATLRGTVVTDAIVPIEGATVRLLGSDQTLVTDATGEFSFAALEPGTYVAEARKVGYLPRQAEATLSGTDASLRIVLPIDPEGVPFLEVDDWQGYIECSAYVVAALVAACDTLGDAGVSEDEFTTLIDVEPNIRHLQSELIWQSNQDLGDTLQIIMSYASQATHDSGSTDSDFFSGTGQSPVLMKIPGESANGVDLGNTYELKPRVFAGRSAQTQQMLGLTVAQDFTLYTHVFHGYEPPASWRFSDGTPVPQPPS